MNAPYLIFSHSSWRLSTLKNPALIHITDDKSPANVKTRCNRTLKYFSQEHRPLALEQDFLTPCPKCGTLEDFQTVNDQRRAEIAAAEEETVRRETEAMEIRKERKALRSYVLSEIVSSFETKFFWNGEIQTTNLHGLDYCTTTVELYDALGNKQTITIKIEVSTEPASYQIAVP